MKKLFLYMMMAGMTACTNDDNVAQTQQPAAGAKVYQVCIPASIGDGSQTRAIELGTGDKDGYLVSTFKTTDNIYVKNVTQNRAASGNLNPEEDGKTANLTGGLQFFNAMEFINYPPQNDDELLLCYTNRDNNTFDYTGQTGTLAGLNNYDYATATVTVESASEDREAPEYQYYIETSDAHFMNAQSMFKFSFNNLPTGVSVKSLAISSSKSKLYSSCNIITNIKNYGDVNIALDDAARTANGAGNIVYAALQFDPLGSNETDDITFTIVGTDNKVYLATKASPAGGFQNGKYYTSTIEVYPQNVNLSTVTQTDGKGVKYYAAQNGQILTGKFSGDGGYITIADGAMVTLAGADIIEPNYVSSPPYYCDHAAIHCLGNANIILDHKAGASGTDDYNRAKAGQGSHWPAVYVPQGKTLTISGTGKLWANGENSSGGAGIGGGSYQSCGNITIAGGIIPEAKGASGAAGIGGGGSSCGNILICGGTIGSYGAADFYGAGAVGGDNAPGIGNPYGGCGNITITAGITYLKFTKGKNSEFIIGGASRGTVTICGEEVGENSVREGYDGYYGNSNAGFLNSTCPQGKEWILYH